MFDHLTVIKKILAFGLAVLGGALFVTLILGAIFFDVEASYVASWFIGVILIFFVLLFIYALLAFIGWFLFTRPLYPGAVFVLALLAVFLGLIILWLVNKPAVDLGTYLDPIFSFLK